MKIGIDVDETVTQWLKDFLKLYNSKKGTDISCEEVDNYNLWEFFGIPREEAFAISEDFHKSEDLDNLDLIEGSQEIINKLAEENEIFFITARPPYSEEKTRTFLKKHFPEVEHEVFFTNEYFGTGKSKEEVCSEIGIDLMIDDSKGVSKNCAEKGIKVLLLDKLWNRGVEHENIVRIKNWNEVLEKI